MSLIQKIISTFNLIVLAVLFFSISANAQDAIDNNSTEFLGHMKFMGVPIDGELDTFISSLELKGLEGFDKSDTGCYVKGRFFSYDKVYMQVHCEPRLNKTVYKVEVYLSLTEDSCEDLWERIKDKYADVKRIYYAKDSNLGSFFCIFPAKKDVEVDWNNKQTFGNFISLEKIKNNNWGNYVLTYWDRQNYIKHIDAEDSDL